MIKHTGFCLGEYSPETCHDCLSQEECLELARDERQDQIHEIDQILAAINLRRIIDGFRDHYLGIIRGEIKI